jgi:hypothetical protein
LNNLDAQFSQKQLKILQTPIWGKNICHLSNGFC